MKNFVFYILIAFAAIALTPEGALAQEVEGTVTDAETDNPLPGVNIIVKGTQQGTATNENGNYSLTVPTTQDTLVFSFIGYTRKEVPIAGRSTVNVSLQQRGRQLEEVIVSGYQTQRRETNTGAVSILETEDFESEVSANTMTSLQGQIAGVTIDPTGSPAGDATVRIRGESTLNNNNPLYIIDGVPTKESAFQVLNGNDIASLQVLKSAPAASIYGARASNGVIVVETKNATPGEISVNYSSKVSITNFADKLDMCDRECRARAQWRALVNDGNDPGPAMPNVTIDWERKADGAAVLNDLKFDESIIPGYRASDTDWQNVVERTGLKQSHSLSAAIGGESSSAYLSLNVFNNKHVVKNKNFRRFSGRVNTEFQFFEGDLTVGENLMINNGINSGMRNYTNTGSGGSPFGRPTWIRPILPVFTESGEYSGPPTGNFVDNQSPIHILHLNRDDQVDDLNIFGSIFLDFKLTDNITLSTTGGLDVDNRHFMNLERRYFAGFMSRDPNVFLNNKRQRIQRSFSQTIEYSNSIGDHSITVLGGGEIIDENFESNRTRSTDFEVQNFDFIVEDAAVGTKSTAGSRSAFTLLSGFTTVDYSYQNKYLFSGTLRRDGSSKLGRNDRWGTFPAVSVGWRLGQEDFIQENTDIITALKARAEWGKAGNQDIDPEASFSIFRPSYGSDDLLTPPWERGYDFAYSGTAYDIEGNNTGSLPSGFRKTQTGNPNLRWETATEYNIGLDFGLFQNRLSGTVEYYNRENTDILINPPFLAVKGEGGEQFFNGATVEVSGAEVSTTWDDNVGPVDYSITANITSIDDEITELPDAVVDAFPGNQEKNILGHSQNALFGYVADGIFDNQEEVDNHAEQTGAAPGRLRYKDLNNDGKINTLDQKYLGTSTPDWEYGINLRANYSNFDFRIFIQGVRGVSVFDEWKERTDFTSLGSGSNYGRRVLDAWRPGNKDSDIPALTLQDTNDEGRPSTYFIANGNYLKVRDITIGYSFRDRIPYTSKARVFFSGANLLEFHDEDSFTSPDPEFPEGGFPRLQEFTMGVNLSF